ncbi:efflux RND transporter periplasmic adaptor subunit [Candidatus Zixiibacteriota bacterium]
MNNTNENQRRGIPRWLYGAGLAAVAIITFMILTRPGEGTALEEHLTVKVVQGEMEIRVTGSGRIRAARAREIEVPNDVNGEVQINFLIEEGTVVTAGQIIAELDTTSTVEELEADLLDLDTAEAAYEQLLDDHINNIKNLENSVRSAQISHEQALLQRENLEFSSELEQQQGDLNIEKARISLNEANRKLEAQKIINEMIRQRSLMNLEEDREDLAELRDELESLTIRAPIDGMVIHAEQGRWTERTKIREGDQVRRGQTILELPDLTELLVEIRVNELDAELIEVGQQAWVRLEAYPRVQLPGRILDISTLAQEFQGNVKVFPAVIQLDEADTRARPGMTASADIVVVHLEDVVQVPLAAVGVIDGHTYVRLHDTHQPLEISLGLWNESMAQVLDGLDVGEEVDLAWLQDPAAVLATLAGTKAVPDDVAQAIISMGDEYGAASPVAAMDEMIMQGGSEQRGDRGGMGGGEGRTRGGDAGSRTMSFDATQMTPEMMEQMRQGGMTEMMQGGDRTAGAREAGGDVARQSGGMTGRFNDQLQGMLESLPADLRAEAEQLMSGQGDFRSISQALRDSLGMGSRGGERQPGEARQFTMRTAQDTTGTAARIEQLRAKRESLSAELKTELDSFIEGGASDFRSLSPALMDSVRAWGILGRGGRQRTPPPPPMELSEETGRYRS